MEQLETNTHRFIIRIWLEATAYEAGRAIWRGHITHVPGGERHYLKDLDDIIDFITPYLEGMGVKPGLFWQARKWLNRFKLRFKA
jgi:hypothetical protein